MDRLKEPIIGGELDVASGYYWCPWGCGPTTNDPLEAMWHEVRHFCPEDEIEELKQDYGPIEALSISCGFVLELTESEPPRVQVWQGEWKGFS